MHTIVIDNIDFNLLRDQKTALLSIRQEILAPAQADALEGILCLIDAIQDYAVDVLGVNKESVFNFTPVEYV